MTEAERIKAELYEIFDEIIDEARAIKNGDELEARALAAAQAILIHAKRQECRGE